MRLPRLFSSGRDWAGDPEQVASLYRELGPAIFRQCLGLLRDREEAADATHEVFMKLLGERKVKDRDHAAAWVYSVATRHCLNVLRNARRRGESLRGESLTVAPRLADELHLERNLVERVLDQVDEENCQVAVGVLVHEIDQVELAKILGLSRRTVARRLERFLEQARRVVEGAPS